MHEEQCHSVSPSSPVYLAMAHESTSWTKNQSPGPEIMREGQWLRKVWQSGDMSSGNSSVIFSKTM